MKRIYLCIAVLLLGSACSNTSPNIVDNPIVSSCYENGKGGINCRTNGNAGLVIPQENLEAMKTRALQGAGDDALKLGNYYSYVLHDTQEGSYWIHISAEDGFPVGMYSLGVYMKDTPLGGEADEMHDPAVRASYWLKRAQEAGYPPDTKSN